MTYIALTIGPIYKTLMLAKKTRELWVASYLFSHLMRTIVKDLTDKGVDFVVPYVPKKDSDEYKPLFEPTDIQKNGTGLFGDRLILKVSHEQDADWNQLIKAIEKAKAEAVSILGSGSDDFVNKYFQFYATEATIDTEEEKANPVKAMDARLDVLECFESYYPDDFERDFIGELFASVNHSKLKKMAFAKEDRGSFPSLYEIAPSQLVNQLTDEQYREFGRRCDSDKSEDDPIKFLKEKYGKQFKPYHNYFCIINADGDGFGARIKELGSDVEKLQAFSQKVFSYSASVAGICKAYGGFTIYAGGDDMLVFLPLISSESKTVFDAITDLRASFDEKLAGENVTLSFGVSITYLKFPLREALSISHDALTDGAKTFPCEKSKPCLKKEDECKKEHTKNAISIHLQKHSGQTHKLTFDFTGSIKPKFLDLLKAELSADEKHALPHSFHHSLSNYRATIDAIGRDDDRLKAFFANAFNEQEHKEKHQTALESARRLLHAFYADGRYEEPFEAFFHALSIVKHCRGDE